MSSHLMAFKIEPAQVAELEDLLDEEQYLKEIEN